MAVRILRRIRAVQDAEDFAAYISRDSLTTAIRFLENTEATLKYLSEFPSVGSPVRSDHPGLENLRACRVSGFPNHLVFYIEHHNAIEVVRILHGAQDVDAELRTS